MPVKSMLNLGSASMAGLIGRAIRDLRHQSPGGVDRKSSPYGESDSSGLGRRLVNIRLVRSTRNDE
ncbi:hypothetical protein M2432_004648 [Mycobacterium sp. OTB74]|nr:hypothetical protein [Mycobacterium sp. OTB74]